MYIAILVKQAYWYISRVSDERLQDHWSSGFPLELIIEQSKHTCTNVKFLKDRYTNYTSVALSGLAEVEKASNPIELSVD